MVKNLAEETLIGQRIVLDHIRVTNYNPIKELLVNGRNSHRAFTQKLAERKKEELKNGSSQQLESINNEILALNQKKDLLEDKIAELKKGSDDMSIEVEKQSTLELLSKSNALKRAATEKQVELDACLKEKKKLFERKKQL